MTHTGPILGTTLYSFTNEWQQKLFTLEGLVEKVAALGLGPALEVVGFQTFRDYPDISDETARNFRALLDRCGLIPSCLSGNSDVGRRKGQLMTHDEIVAYIERQLVSAKKLGFPVLRIQAFVGPKVMEALAPIAERYGVHVAGELHSPLSADHPEVVALRECYDRVGSPYLGFVPDFSSTMTAITVTEIATGQAVVVVDPTTMAPRIAAPSCGAKPSRDEAAPARSATADNPPATDGG